MSDKFIYCLFLLICAHLFIFTYSHPHAIGCDETFCYLPIGNLTNGRNLTVDSNCDRFDTHTQHSDSSQNLGATLVCPVTGNVEKLIDGSLETAWISKLGQSEVTIQLDLEDSFHFVGVDITFLSKLPQSIIIEGSSDNGVSWRAYQYYSLVCEQQFALTDVEDYQRCTIDEVICTSNYIGNTSVGGTLLFELLPESLHTLYGVKPLSIFYPRNVITITNVRIRLKGFQALPPSERYFSISNIEVLGACLCFGHADTCLPKPGYEGVSVPGTCQCKHNTAGDHCELCPPTYSANVWAVATDDDPNFCKICQCNSHTDICNYEYEREISVCDNCTHNTVGDSCEYCKDGYFQNPYYIQKGILFHPDICLACNCDSKGSLSTTCNSHGYCQCRLNVRGIQCNMCKYGYYGLSADNPNGCKRCMCGIGALGCNPITGACICKKYTTGPTCSQCLPGYAGPITDLSVGCVKCDCALGGSEYPNSCDMTTGRCLCRRGVGGKRCDEVLDGYYVEAITAADISTRLASLVIENMFVATELYNYWYDDIRICDLGSMENNSTCCTHVEKLISFYLNDGGLECACSPKGSTSVQNCNKCGGQCDCHTYTGGRSCNMCTANIGACLECPRYSPLITDCIPCYCNGFSNTCSGQSGLYIQTLTSDFSDQIWLTTGDTVLQATDIFNPITNTTSPQLVYYFNNSSPSANFIFPPEFIGDQRNSYSLEFSVSFKANFNNFSLSLRLFSNNATALDSTYDYIEKYVNTSSVQIPSVYTYVFPFIEANTYNLDMAATINQFRHTLVDLDRMELLVTPTQTDRNGLYVELTEVWLKMAIRDDNLTSDSLEEAYNIESCVCGEEYTGEFCEKCSNGFTRDPENAGQFATCVPCFCSRRSNCCDAETGLCCDCSNNTTGQFCHICAEGFYGFPDDIDGCRQCMCPFGPFSSFQVTNSCLADATSHICACPIGYSGNHCEMCSPGYKGDPMNGVPCDPCDACHLLFVNRTSELTSHIETIQSYITMCYNWTDEWSFLQELNTNITNLNSLVSSFDPTSKKNLLCEISELYSDISLNLSSAIYSINTAFSSAYFQILRNREQFNIAQIQSNNASSISIGTAISKDTIVELFTDFRALFNSANFVNTSKILLAQSQQNLASVNQSKILLTNAQLNNEMVEQIFNQIDIVSIQNQIAGLKSNYSLLLKLLNTANQSLCGENQMSCDNGSYSQLAYLLNIFTAKLSMVSSHYYNLSDYHKTLNDNNEWYSDIRDRMLAIRSELTALNNSICPLIPKLTAWIDNIYICIDNHQNASILFELSSQIHKLSISLTLSQVQLLVTEFNQILKFLQQKHVFITDNVDKYDLLVPFSTDLKEFIANLTVGLELLDSIYNQLITYNQTFNSDHALLASDKILLAKRMDQFEILKIAITEAQTNLSSLESLSNEITNNLTSTEIRRADNQRNLATLTAISEVLISNMTSLRRHTQDLMDTSSQKIQIVNNLSENVIGRFNKLNTSYTKILELKSKVILQLAKLGEVESLADNLNSRQSNLDALISLIETNIVNNIEIPEFKSTVASSAKCLNYPKEGSLS